MSLSLALNATQITSSKGRLQIAYRVMLTLLIMPGCLAPAVRTAILLIIGPPLIPARILLLRMKVGGESIMVRQLAARVIHLR